MSASTSRPSALIPLPSKEALLEAYNGLPLSALPTPALLLDRSIIRRNATRMAEIAASWDVPLRVHIKTHKTAEGTREMIQPTGKSGRVVVSTLAEAWGLLDAGLVKEGVVEDIIYGLPVSAARIPQLAELRSQVQKDNQKAQVRLLIDNESQIEALAAHDKGQAWSIMVKLDNGGGRAGLPADSPAFSNLLRLIAKTSSQVSLYGFYAHAGHSYDSRQPSEADAFLTSEVQAVIQAASIAQSIFPSASSSHLVLSVGSTPTAHAASRAPSSATLARVQQELPAHCELELHAGNYPFLDLQQLATRAMPNITGASQPSQMGDVTVSVLCSVISTYPGRGTEAGSTEAPPLGEALIDAGGIAFSKDRGPWGGFGHVVYPTELRGWQLGRPSQEHGILTLREGGPAQWEEQWTLGGAAKAREMPRMPDVGERVMIVPQHACMTLAAHPFYFIVDEQPGTTQAKPFEPRVVDIWVPWKGW
ncbi:hypothetical protein BCV69DRAFT_173974 [Microstroma glucosiphilum]|uniref:D-serine dehydratase n=1 Tax=Pseudomicrostroma glucosiphilum TaxID=1684307 RepID=A0A316UAS4_9BASI|nr:hypothetical protein BCV69DRAFT_173974 [Pseudomicrostroma glucosiphilum]PWN21571.1 hypothetical protein BCV69DRAFT_173974 [Pseudomicrostroma glucosiphilum]